MPAEAAATPLVEADHLTVRLGGALVLDEVSVKVDAGEIVTIIACRGERRTSLVAPLPRSSRDRRRRGGR